MASVFTAPVFPGPGADPVGAVTNAAFEKFAFPAEARAGGAEGWAGLFPDRYADPPTRQFPIHDPGAVAASAACYFYLNGPQDHPVAGRIKAACAAYGLSPLWEKLAADSVPPAPTRFCLPAAGKYPVDTPARVKEAFAYLEAYADAFPAATRREYAGNLVKATADLGGLDPAEQHRAEWYAGYGRPSDAAAAFVGRKAAAAAGGKDDLVRALDRAEEAVKAGADCYAAVGLLKLVDRTMGWDFEDPTEALTGLTPQRMKEATAGLVVAPSGNVYRRDDLALVPAELAAGWGVAAGSTLSKRASLLREDASGDFEALLEACGVEPVGCAKRSERIDWDSLASDS